MRITCRVAPIVAMALAVGCNDRGETSSRQSPLVAVTASTLDRWLGKWSGPEGTFLVISKKEDHYHVTIQSLDGPASYAGKQVEDRIEFERNGKTESIRATDGKGTGMKWLQDKTNCLTINLSEGFCRD